MKKSVGAKIQSIRESKEISREELSERSGLNMDQILRVEEHEDLPALSTLIKIARVLGVRLGTFLDDSDELGPIICRKDERRSSISFSTGETEGRKQMDYLSLSKSKSDRHMEPFYITIEPGQESDIVLSTHEGEEFLFVLEGEIEVSYGKNRHRVLAGDSIYYDSIVPHHVHAVNQTARIVAVVYTPL